MWEFYQMARATSREFPLWKWKVSARDRSLDNLFTKASPRKVWAYQISKSSTLQAHRNLRVDTAIFFCRRLNTMVPLKNTEAKLFCRNRPPQPRCQTGFFAFSLPVQSSTMSETRYERQGLYMASSREIQHKDQPTIPPWWSKVYDPVELVAGPCRLGGASRRGKNSHTVTLAFGIVWYVFAMFAHVTQVSERLNWGWVNTSDTIFSCSNSLWAIFCPSSGFLTRPKWQVLTRLDSSVLSMARARFSACQSRGTWTSSGLQAGT